MVMGIVTYSQESVSTIAPSRLFKALAVDAHILLPKIMPHAVKSIETLEGDGGVGTIIVTYSQESVSTIAPSRLFKALAVDAHILLPKIMPHAVKSIETLEGDGGVGTIRKTTFPEGSPVKYVIHKTNEIDAENFVFKYTMIEGDGLSDKFECVVHENKLEAKNDGGCVCKMTSTYHTKIDISEEIFKDAENMAKGAFLLVEQHLIANPELCA